MASKYRRKSKKIGPFTTRNITYNANGTRTESYSTVSPTTRTRRTTSYNSKRGTTRTTRTSKMGGGWLYRTQRTTGGGKWNWSKKKRSTGSTGGASKNFKWNTVRYSGNYIGLTTDELLNEWGIIFKWVAKWIVVPLVIIYVLV